MLRRVVNTGTTVTVMMRFVGIDQSLVTQMSVASITRKVGSQNPVTLTVADAVFDSPQTDDGWEHPDEGYNFKDRFTAVVGVNVATYTFMDSDGNPMVEKIKLDGV